MNDPKFCFRSEESFHQYLLSVVDQTYIMAKSGKSVTTIKKMIIDATVSVTKIVGVNDELS